ncbi:MAG: signal peptidase I [Lachnospiraceae bacterium]|nr:signal peptidase I [Lachnospiraceae bacterium]
MSIEENSTLEKKDFGIKGFLFEIFDLLVYALIILSITYIILGFVEQRTDVEGSSMNITLNDKDSVFVDKISYRFKDPERYDIVVFKFLHADDTYYIKRIIGLPGETVQIIDGKVYINGQMLTDDNYGYADIDRPERAVNPITLGEGEYFVMGDNRNGSTDSRFSSVGNVQREQIVGRAFMRIWPLNQIKFLKKDINNRPQE